MSGRKSIPGEALAKRALRQEVAFGCPICRSPFLEFHHFDPPWSEEPHWRPEGMIALCPTHHKHADGGNFTRDELLAMKEGRYTFDSIGQKFPWARQQQVVARLGGLYAVDCPTVLRVNNEAVIGIESGDGCLLVSFDLRGADGISVARMHRNVLSGGPGRPHDVKVTVTGSRIKVWFAPGEIGFEVSLRRKSEEDLTKLLKEDHDRVAAKRRALSDFALGNLPLEIREELRRQSGEGLQPEHVIDARIAKKRLRAGLGLPEHLMRAHVSGDPVGYLVRQSARDRCLDSDGHIWVLNFETISVFCGGRRARFRNGIGGVDYNAVVNCETAFALTDSSAGPVGGTGIHMRLGGAVFDGGLDTSPSLGLP